MERMTNQPVLAPAEDELVVTPAVIEPPVSLRKRLISGVSVIVIGLICALAWGIGAKSGDAVFALADPGAKIHITDVHVPAELAGIVLGAVIIALGVWQVARGFSRRNMRWVLVAVLACFVAAFLCWVGSANSAASLNLVGLFQNTIFLAIPLILGALAGILCERSGVINIAIEGQLLAGAFAGALAATMASSLGVGVIVAVVAGGLMGALLAVFAIRYLVNQVVLGVVLNAFALGVTGFGYDALMQTNGETYNNPGFLSPIKLPVLSDIPVIGEPLFHQNYIVYLTYALIVIIDVSLFRTRWGLRTRAVGEHPKAADTVGIKVLRTRYRNVILGGLVAGLGGAYLTIGAVGAFSKDISSGKGFIALAAVIFGRWSPRGAVGAALLFGFTDALQSLLSVVGTPVKIPSAFLTMLPYLATLFAVAGLVGRVQAPAADGEPYVKG
jgi:general nucleoside transport system permease protein